MDLGILIFRCSCALPMPSRFALTRWYVVEWWTPQAHRISSIWYFAMKGCADITPHCDGASSSHSFRSALDWFNGLAGTGRKVRQALSQYSLAQRAWAI